MLGRTNTASGTGEASVIVIRQIITAPNDTVYYYDENGNKTIIGTADANGIINNAFVLAIGSTNVYSTIAKSTTSLSNPYTKQVSFSKDIDTLKLMPESALYWYGYKNDISDYKATLTIRSGAYSNLAGFVTNGKVDLTKYSKIKAYKSDYSSYTSHVNLIQANSKNPVYADLTYPANLTGGLNSILTADMNGQSNNHVIYAEIVGNSAGTPTVTQETNRMLLYNIYGSTRYGHYLNAIWFE